ncbi:uncharacterized protein LOC113375724 [Ctenocephalides felis]|uniref:uncharacterized protein LOC113375724 n=1 Tax=Ctenocephalides felis TaxID=7515 RepID=UPI000E6E1224|nr:uncharacterized protein LOC113375724 [Ctenocephalides felis]
MESVKSLTNKKRGLKAQFMVLDNACNKLINRTLSDLNVRDIEEYLNKLNILEENYVNVINNLANVLDDEEEITKLYDIDLISVLNDIKRLTDNFNQVKNKIPQTDLSNNNIRSEQSQSFNNNIKLPNIALPTFDGSYSNWLQFNDSFTALIHNNTNLSNAEKFYYLKTCLKNEAASVIHSLPSSSANYEIAWGLLRDRFENKKIIINNHIRSLFNHSEIKTEDFKMLRILVDSFNKNLRCLEALGEPVNNWDSLIMYLILTKVDSATRREWELSNNKGSDISKFSDLVKFLDYRCQVFESLYYEKLPTIESHKQVSLKSDKVTRSYAISNALQCVLCKKSHPLFKCEEFRKLKVNERISQVQQLKTCTNCLNTNHQIDNCSVLIRCVVCHEKHNTLLHCEELANPLIESIPSTSFVSNVNLSQVLLSTAVISVLNKNNAWVPARILLDNGSQSNFITQEFSKKLALKTEKLNLSVSDSIASNIPAISFSSNHFKIPPEIKLADPNYNISGRIDMLLGAGLFWSLLRKGFIKLSKTNTILQNTALGWIISSTIQSHHSSNETICNEFGF